MDNHDIVHNNDIRIPPIPPNHAGKNVNQAQNIEVIQKNNSLSSAKEETFLSIVWGVIKSNLKNAPNLIKQHFMWLGPLALLWLTLGTGIYGLSNKIALPAPVISFIALITFLSCSYTNSISMALYADFIGREIIPIIKKINKSGFKGVIKTYTDKYTKTAKIILKSFKEKGTEAYIMLLGFGGAGFILSNFLTRNNKTMTYFICITTALSIYSSMSRGLNDTSVRIFRALLRDVGRLFNLKTGISISSLYISFSSLAAGLVLSFIFWGIRVSNSFYDPTGYIVGAVCVIVSIALYIKSGVINAA
jgi:hypothetical protein